MPGVSLQSKELESKLMDTMKQKTIELGEMDTGNSSWIDLRYLEESTRQLFLVRSLLSRGRTNFVITAGRADCVRCAPVPRHPEVDVRVRLLYV